MSTYFFPAAQRIRARCNDGILCMLDFDGTLVPIVDNPADCRLSTEVKQILKDISGGKNNTVAIISGRQLSDLRKRVGIKNIYYGGSHGLEISGPAMEFVHPETEHTKRPVELLKRSMEKEFHSIPGILIESKPFSFAFHYRMLPQEDIKSAVRRFRHLVLESTLKHRISVLRGKKVLEVIPRINWDKGAAVNYIRDLTGGRVCPVYVGDDRTDESAFKALEHEGITVRVGQRKNTAASYHLKNQKEIVPFLRFFSRNM